MNETYKRNALNNGLLVLECAPLVKAMKAKYEARKERETVQDDAALSLDLEQAKISWCVVPCPSASVSAYFFNFCGEFPPRLNGPPTPPSRGNNVFAIPPVGTIAQELILAGGLEPWIQQQLKAEAA